jgi:DNA processing protein
MLPGMEAIEQWLTLIRAPGLHIDLLRPYPELLAHPPALLSLAPEALRALELPAAATRWLRAPDAARVASDLRWFEASHCRLLVWGSDDYPPLLAATPSAPLALFVRGEPAILLSVQLAMVGSRNPTAGARRDAGEFATAFAQAGLTITSGLALGIDAASHEGALNGGRTIAVLGTGLDEIYPAENRALADRILAQAGALVSEFPPGTVPLPQNFPRRNRLISGLTIATLVIEAAQHSGSLITARLAAAQGRDVFALPGSIHNPLSRGCHRLIRAGAALVETPAEVLSHLNIPFIEQTLRNIAQPLVSGSGGEPRLDKDYKILLDALGFDPVSIDALVDRTGLPSQSLASMLLILELEGRVGMHPGGRYVQRS